MALVLADLQQDLVDVFASMTDGKDETFVEGLANAFKDFFETGTVATQDSGIIPSGTFTGSSTSATITCSTQRCEETMLESIQFMKEHDTGGNESLAKAIAEGLSQLGEDTEIVAQVSGSSVPPSGTPVTVTGTAKGCLMLDSSTIETVLLGCFTSMAGMVSGGDQLFALQLATSVNAMLIAPDTVHTQGEGNLEGSQGVGLVT